MSDSQWKLIVRFMLFAMARLSHLQPPLAEDRVVADQLKDDLELQLK